MKVFLFVLNAFLVRLSVSDLVGFLHPCLQSSRGVCGPRSRAESHASVLNVQQTVGVPSSKPEEKERAKQLPPGPTDLFGQISFLFKYALLPVRQVFAECRRNYGPVFCVKAGPTTQVWIGNFKVLEKIYALPECSGRLELEGRPFGDFLFRLEDPTEAQKVREEQAAWIKRNIVGKDNSAAVSEGMESFYSHVMNISKEGVQAVDFPFDEVSNSIYRVLIGTLWGSYSLSDEELARLRDALHEFLQFRLAPNEKKRTALAQDIRSIILKGLQRLSASNSESDNEDLTRIVLPLTVATITGGVDVLPTFFEWLVLYLASDPEKQSLLRQLDPVSPEGHALYLKEIYRCLRVCPYSIGMGPPRRTIADVTITLDPQDFDSPAEAEVEERQSFTIPKGALLFALHPTVTDEAGRAAGASEEEYGRQAFGTGLRSCIGRPIAEGLLPLLVHDLLRKFEVNLIAADPDSDSQSSSAALGSGSLLKQWVQSRVPSLVRTKDRGMLFAPDKVPKMVFRPLQV
uniref:Cytochrome P450 n=1 Tax=Chromera velia CCMP2878 TaxID=1169474 RepID=A0A0G4GFX2_9ALVE|mmetsp:Transcript_31372/g.61965  ORF Transcript_31372/g.61965 Transcript_31372/m.61965 type:complete len:516 (+) Transcript_31372:197-1744(+)|eukprot:Cvel_4652.t1-p1 / transcript=Cvel_4652.t1 / gene=Cvel_4652 / organism=Chromera_velia_CCMP2878 / gene_product=hypothetical protein / transcript_product=hypothetical protein / location=Cvel_scaffold205:70999-73430(-) / protein_length=515 / sequence_SO=supercontig / SO=protein_coding / is_pseudo=false